MRDKLELEAYLNGLRRYLILAGWSHIPLFLPEEETGPDIIIEPKED